MKKNTILSTACLIAIASLLIWCGIQQVGLSGQKKDIRNLQRQVGVQYLCLNEVWERDVLEQLPMFAGLYDDLNTYDKVALLAWNDKLPSLALSKQWNSIIKTYQSISDSVLSLDKRNTYARDGYITVQKYVNELYVKDSIQRKKSEARLAKDYLDNNKIWQKDVLAKYECLNGLWDVLLNVQLQRLYQYPWSGIIEGQEISSLTRLVTLSKAIRHDSYGFRRLENYIRKKGIIKETSIQIDMYLQALEDYKNYVNNPYYRGEKGPFYWDD